MACTGAARFSRDSLRYPYPTTTPPRDNATVRDNTAGPTYRANKKKKKIFIYIYNGFYVDQIAVGLLAVVERLNNCHVNPGSINTATRARRTDATGPVSINIPGNLPDEGTVSCVRARFNGRRTLERRLRDWSEFFPADRRDWKAT